MLEPGRYLFLCFALRIVQKVAARVHDLDELTFKRVEVTKNLMLGLLHALELWQVQLQIQRVNVLGRVESRVNFVSGTRLGVNDLVHEVATRFSPGNYGLQGSVILILDYFA